MGLENGNYSAKQFKIYQKHAKKHVFDKIAFVLLLKNDEPSQNWVMILIFQIE